jgi:hypothetical protein
MQHETHPTYITTLTAGKHRLSRCQALGSERAWPFSSVNPTSTLSGDHRRSWIAVVKVARTFRLSKRSP